MKNIIVREYLESLAERDELDYLFPLLLEAMNFKIISTPKQTKGLPQYGKDVVAVGNDPQDGMTKRFYFELKGGQDRNVTTATYSKNDGIRESIIEAKDRPFHDTSNPEFNKLPVKIVLVHNGDIHPSVKETFDGFIEREFPEKNFERWDIFELTRLFTENLFNEYLLTDDKAVTSFKKVLVLINTPGNTFSDYYHLINSICNKAADASKLGERKQLLFFETFNLISFIIYSYSVEAKNLETAKHCLSYTCLKLWNWILRNKLEEDVRIVKFYRKHVTIFIRVLREYFEKTLPVARLENGLWSDHGGRYEQVGYPLRSFEYVSYLLVWFELLEDFEPDRSDFHQEEKVAILADILNHNRSTTRPLLDNHSIPIGLVLYFLIRNSHTDEARIYMNNVIESVKLAYLMNKRLPDGRNQIESVIRYIVTGVKSIYYQDKTSHLFGMMSEFMAILNMEQPYAAFRKFILDAKVDLALFIPYSDSQLKEVFPENDFSHEIALLDHQLVEEGYQSEILLEEDFATFKAKTFAKNEFSYEYRTRLIDFTSLLVLAHVSFKTPLFPYFWRPLKLEATFREVKKKESAD